MKKILLLTLLCNIINTMEQESKDRKIEKFTYFSTAISEIEQRNSKISQFLENPDTPKRLKMEISELLKNKNLLMSVSSTNSKIHPFEVKINFHDDTAEHLLTCNIPNDYPFKAPFLFLETKSETLSAKDLIAIKRKLNDGIWNPSIRMSEIIDGVGAKIKFYENEKMELQLIAEGHERTIDHLKEKYLVNNPSSDIKYPELQEKLSGVWIKEMPMGYFVFHVEGDYINMAFEPKYIEAASQSYRGPYAAGYHKSGNSFEIHTSDTNESATHQFYIYVHSDDSISIKFASLRDDSILDDIESKLRLGFVLGESIELVKIK